MIVKNPMKFVQHENRLRERLRENANKWEKLSKNLLQGKMVQRRWEMLWENERILTKISQKCRNMTSTFWNFITAKLNANKSEESTETSKELREHDKEDNCWLWKVVRIVHKHTQKRKENRRLAPKKNTVVCPSRNCSNIMFWLVQNGAVKFCSMLSGVYNRKTEGGGRTEP